MEHRTSKDRPELNQICNQRLCKLRSISPHLLQSISSRVGRSRTSIKKRSEGVQQNCRSRFPLINIRARALLRARPHRLAKVGISVASVTVSISAAKSPLMRSPRCSLVSKENWYVLRVTQQKMNDKQKRRSACPKPSNTSLSRSLSYSRPSRNPKRANFFQM